MSPLRVTYELPSARKRETVTASEVSLGGLFLETTERPNKGSFVSVEIESGTTKVVVDGRVLAVRPGGFAVGFIDLPNDVASTLSFILTTRMPQRGTQLGLGEPEEGIPSHPSAPKVAALGEPAPPIEDAYAPAEPRHPTPRMMPVAPPSSSNAFPPVALGPPSSGTLPPPRPTRPPPPRTNLVVWIALAVIVLGLLAALSVMVSMYLSTR